MTQVESGKEEGAQPSKCDNHGSSGDSQPSSHNEVPAKKKLQHPKAGACAVKKSSERNTSSPNHINHRLKSVEDNMKMLKVFRNGDNLGTEDVPFKKDSENTKTWSEVLDMLTVTMFPNQNKFNVTRVFTTKGKKVLSVSELEGCSEIVVCCGSDSYEKIPYGVFAVGPAPPRKVISKTSKIRRAERDSIVKSVIFETPSSIVEEISQNQTSRKHPMVKTLSEQDVSNIENSVMSESMSPKLRTRNTHSPKPRPVSAYHQVASVHGGDRRSSPMTGLVSRIPKRIIGTANHNSRGSSPNVSTVNTVNNVLSYNNLNNRNISHRRIPESKPSTERTSRHGKFITTNLVPPNRDQTVYQKNLCYLKLVNCPF